jgi:hypothetical protein
VAASSSRSAGMGCSGGSGCNAKRVSTVGLSSGGRRRKAAVGSDHLDEPGDTEMDVALHRLETRLAALEALVTRSCVECERLQPDGEPGWKMYVTVDDEPALYCPECAEREFGAGSAR